jgi:GH15 family glucan-1,4-alpha-glucosidase
MPYQPIEDYGIIGNMRTAALVGRDGSIDWYCFPNFDSPSVFCALLDDRKGGRFQIAPTDGDAARRQFYWPDTNVLVSRFLTADGVGQVTDFMPVGGREEDPLARALLRRVTVTRGTMRFRLCCQPAFNYARDEHEVEAARQAVRFRSKSLCLELTASVPLERRSGRAEAEFTLEEGQGASFALRPWQPGKDRDAIDDHEVVRQFRRTVNFWRKWLSGCTYTGRWREAIQRSALALKLLTYEPTGAIVAAVTASLPEHLGGGRNWDYRYTWIRDAAFTVYGLMRVGFTEEAARFMDWLEARCHELEPDGFLQIMYGIDGRHELPEEVLSHLEGYRGSSPVRVGNGAARQLQLDIYGELMDSVYLFNKYGTPISYELWGHLRHLTDWVCRNWQREDEGIWEVRGGRRHFVYSKLMCWVAVDRALRLADRRSFPADRQRWMAVRDQIYEEIMAKGWCPERQAFVQSYGSQSLDASTLIMPLVFFLSPTDPRMLSTLEAINRSPHHEGLVSGGLVYRYDVQRAPDGLPEDEGTFNICTFWLVEAMVRAAGHVDHHWRWDARIIFEQMLGHANHVGLFSEQTGPRGEALGNFPQAFTHLGLISAGANLDRTLEARQEA